MKNFVLIGAGGFIAPKHMKAIKDTGGNLLAALDKHDSVGVLDSYFPDTDFFTEFERFERHCEKLKRNGTAIHYVSVCSPNYLHDAHCRFGLRIGADVICEKPVVLNPWNVEALMEMEKETGKNIYPILQMRLHPAIIQLKKKIALANTSTMHKVDMKYITARGNWYLHSWKGNMDKSGGIASNIGLHFFDILLWIFGEVKNNIVYEHSATTASGKLELEKASVEWLLSIDEKMLPEKSRLDGKKAFRSLTINGTELEFSEGFEDLHTKSYQNIIDGKGVLLAEAKTGIRLTHDIRFF